MCYDGDMMKRLIKPLLCLLIILTLTACSATSENSVSFEAMDTLMSLKVCGDNIICETLENRAHELDERLSATNPESEIYQLNENGSAKLSGDALSLVKRSLELSKELENSFDPTVFPAVCEWGFISDEYRVPDEKTLAQLAEKIDYKQIAVDDNTVRLPKDVAIDLGAVAKGYLADECRTILADSDASCAILNLGGTILLYGKKPDNTPFKVGVADPENPAGYFGYLACGEGVVATSGGYERYFEEGGKRYIHILDPTTAKPVDNGTLSVTIFSDDGVLSDALSTALFVMGIDKAAYYQAHDDFDFILLTDDNNLYITEGIYDDFTLAEGCDFTLHKISR